MLLESLDSPANLTKYNNDELKILAAEIRNFLISKIAVTGGHLASNLGVVELTLALHRVFDINKDSIIWDVGHQCYVHKMLTGRCDRFDTLRKFGGLSGFPKLTESKFDCFGTGHSSTSISAALGIARARDLKGEKSSVIAVIGDGAMTGGMTFEALNDAGTSKTNLIVILNDNRMSISRNVGGMAGYFEKLRLKPKYYKTKEKIEKKLETMNKPMRIMMKYGKRLKDSIKHIFMPGTVFEELGFRYYGPVDGNDLGELITILERVKEISGPVLIHICTCKGKGYHFAERNPELFHGIAPFEINTGELRNNGDKTWSNVFGKKLTELAGNDNRIVAITAAMPDGTGLSEFATKYPSRFFDVGIAEQHALTLCCGLASKGMKPVFPVYSSFIQRAYDQIIHDMCIQNLHVVLAVDRAGIVGEDGETHQGIFDISFLRHIPNIVIMAPSDYRELELMLEYAVTKHTGPIAIRYPRGNGMQSIASDSAKLCEIFPGKGCLLRNGKDAALISIGNMTSIALQAAEILNKKGMSATVMNARCIKPLDAGLINKICSEHSLVYTVEDNNIAGGFGSGILEILHDNIKTKPVLLGIPDVFPPHGSKESLYNKYGLNAEKIALRVEHDILMSGTRRNVGKDEKET